MDHVLRYQDTPGVKMIVVLGEVSEPFVKFTVITDIKFAIHSWVFSLLIDWRK